MPGQGQLFSADFAVVNCQFTLCFQLRAGIKLLGIWLKAQHKILEKLEAKVVLPISQAWSVLT